MIIPELSNSGCLPGRAGGSPILLVRGWKQFQTVCGAMTRFWYRARRFVFSSEFIIGTALLGLVVAALAGNRQTKEGRTLVVVVSRSLADMEAPWEYGKDQMRFMGTVVEPLCPVPEDASSSSFRDLRSVAKNCFTKHGKVIVQLRRNLSRGHQDQEVSPKDVKQAMLGLYLADEDDNSKSPPWNSILEVDGRLEVEPNDISPELLLIELSSMPVVWKSDLCFRKAGEDEGAEPAHCLPEGTGQYYVSDFWSRSTYITDDNIPFDLGPLESGVDDVVVLRSRQGQLPLRRIVIAGVDDLLEKKDAVRKAMDQKLVHIVADVEENLGAPGYEWGLMQRPEDSVLVAALNPDIERLTERCRARILDAFRKLSRDPVFLESTGSRSVVQIFPGTMGPVYFQPIPVQSGTVQARDSVCKRKLTILSSKSWSRYVTCISDIFRSYGLDVELDIQNTTEQESEKREKKEYDISILGLVNDTNQPPAYFLWDTLQLSGWMTPDAVAQWKELADREESGNLPSDELRSVLEDPAFPLVALAGPPSYSAISLRLVGFNPSDQFLNVQHLGLETTIPAYLYVIAGGLLMVAFTMFFMAYRFAHRAEVRQKDLQARFSFFHHELTAPLTTIKGAASTIEGEDERTGRIMREADWALDVADQARMIFDRGWRQEILAGEVSVSLEPLIRDSANALRLRAAQVGIPLDAISVDVSCPPDLPPVRLTDLAGSHLVRNLLDNALKYRDGPNLGIKISGEQDGRDVVILFEDHGMGVDARLPNRSLFKLGYRTTGAREKGLEGSGFGLFLCREICTMAGGVIRLSSRKKPTVFEVRLPAAL